MSKPYTYLLKFKPTGQAYYGVKFSKDANPDTFWQSYFTSSQTVKKLIKEHGSDAFEFSIRRCFNSSDDARKWEQKVLRRLDVQTKAIWLNKCIASAPNAMSGSKNPFFGKTHSLETKEIISQKGKGRERSTVAIDKARETLKITLSKMAHHPNKGRKHTQESKDKMSETRTGMVRAPLSEAHKQKISKALIGKSLSEDHKKKVSASLKGKSRPGFGLKGSDNPSFGSKWYNNGIENKLFWPEDKISSEWELGKKFEAHPLPTVICPCCGKSGAKNNMSRYHFDNCKMK